MPEIDVTKDGIPDEIRTIRNWICWREGMRDGKPTKIPTKPYRTNGDINADVTNPEHRRDFDTAWESFNDHRVDADGVGFVFSDDVTIVGIDLDNCRDPDTGEIEEWAETIIDRISSYTEASPSGTGVHILVGGELPPGGNRKGRVEMYDSDRYFTMTGAHVEGTPTEIRKCQDKLEAVHLEFIQNGVSPDGQTTLNRGTKVNGSENGDDAGGSRDTEAAGKQSANSLIERYGDAFRNIRDPAIKEALQRVKTKYLPTECPSTFDDLAGPGVDLSDQEILKRMFESHGGDRKQRLYEGDASMWGSHDADYPSQSEADMALAHNLAFWTGKDPERMNGLFEESGLHREKWERRHYASGATYGDVTLARALLRVDDYYEVPSEDGVKFSKADSIGSGSTSSTGSDDHDLPPMDFKVGSNSGPSETGDAATDETGPLHSEGTNGEAPTVNADVLTDLEDDEEFIPVNPDEDGDPAAVADAYAAGQESEQGNGQALGSGHDSASSTTTPEASTTTGTGVDESPVPGPGTAGSGTAPPTADGREPADPRGLDTDPDLDESTQRMMEASARDAGPGWERTDPTLDDDEKHPADWTVGELRGYSATDQAMRLAREDQRILARKLDRQSRELAELSEKGEENERLRFVLKVYLETMDELMEERARYRTQLTRLGELSKEDAELPDDPVERVKQIMRPKVRREDAQTATETLTGIDAVLQEYEEANERIKAEERERRKQRGFLSRLFR
jgi:putative DNA primase/helicase